MKQRTIIGLTFLSNYYEIQECVIKLFLLKTNINNVIQLPDFTERSRIKDRPNHIGMSSFHIRAYTVTDSNCSMFAQHESGYRLRTKLD